MYTHSVATPLVLITLYLASVQAWTALDIIIKDTGYKVYNQALMEKLEVYTVKHNGRNTINGTFIYSKELSDLQFHFIIDFEKADKTQLRLIDLELDVCKFLNSGYEKLNMAKSILSGLQGSATFPRRCPVEAHKAYKLEYFGVSIEKFPPYLPEVTFTALVTLLTHRKKIYDVTVKGYLRKK